MTDQEVIETLARREGWTGPEQSTGVPDWWIRNGKAYFVNHLPRYTASRDALAPVLARFTDEEWDALFVILSKSIGPSEDFFMRSILTLPPSDLARAIAEVLKGAK